MDISNGNDYSLISGTTGNDSIFNYGSNVTIAASYDNDIIINATGGFYSHLYGGTGNDSIANYSLWDSIYGGDDNDTIGSGSYSCIRGGAGDDFIIVHRDDEGHDTVSGGEGNDILSLGGGNNGNYGGDCNLILYAAGEGNDIIYNFCTTDTLSIGGGSYSTTKSGDDIIVTVGDGKITLVGAANLSGVNIIGTKGSSDNTTLLTVTDSTSSPVTVGSAIKTINASTRTAAVQITGNALNNSIIGGSGNDSLYGGAGNDTLTGGDGSDVFIYGGGNDLITDYATGDKISISSAISKATVSGNDVVFTIGSGKLTVKGGKQKTLTLINSAGVESQTVIGAATTSTLLTVTDSTSSPVTVGSAVKTINATARTKAIKITGNKLANSILGGSGNDSLYGGDDNDTILGNAGNDKLYGQNGNDLLKGGAGNDTLSGGKGNDTLTGGEGNNVFIYGGGNDLIIDFAAGDTLSISSGTVSEVTTSGDNLILKIGTGKITLAGGANETVTYCDSDGEHTYPDTDTSSEVSISGKTIKLLEDYMEDSFNVADYGAKFQTIDASAALFGINIIGNKLMNKIIGSEDDDTIDGGAGRDTIYGGAGNDILLGGAGNDLLFGGNDADTFVFKSGDGNDKILDYKEEDTIRFTSGTPKFKTVGDNVIITLGKGKISVKGAASKTVTYIDKSGKTKYYPTTPKSQIILTDNNKTAILRETYSDSTYTAKNSIKKIDASAVQHNLYITGNSKANVILGSYENDTIYGGKGSDTLQGGSGADVFVYATGDGKDIILDYDEEDTIKITSSKAKVLTKGDDVIFTIGSGKITVLGAADKTVSYIEGGKRKTYGKAASNVLEDDNFITGDDLSALVQSKSVDYSFMNTSTELTKETNLIAYAKEK